MVEEELLKRPKNPSERTKKMLYSFSGNRCSYPDCNQLLVVENFNHIGKVCHIKGNKSTSARYDPNQTDEERQHFDNLILLCPNHHDIVDNDEKNYTVKILKQYKEDHFKKVETILSSSWNDAFVYLYGQFYEMARSLHEETSRSFTENTVLLIHLVPLLTFQRRNLFTLKDLRNHKDYLKPLKSHAINSRTTGNELIVFHQSITKEEIFSYVSVNKSGVMEIADELLLYPSEGKKGITNIGFERRIIERLNEYLRFYKKIEIDPPIFMLISLLNVKDYEIDFGNMYIVALDVRNHKIIEKDLKLPERVIENLDEDVSSMLRPCFDMIWNACNFEQGSPNYDSEGIWIPKGHFG